MLHGEQPMRFWTPFPHQLGVRPTSPQGQSRSGVPSSVAQRVTLTSLTTHRKSPIKQGGGGPALQLWVFSPPPHTKDPIYLPFHAPDRGSAFCGVCSAGPGLNAPRWPAASRVAGPWPGTQDPRLPLITMRLRHGPHKTRGPDTTFAPSSRQPGTLRTSVLTVKDQHVSAFSLLLARKPTAGTGSHILTTPGHSGRCLGQSAHW